MLCWPYDCPANPLVWHLSLGNRDLSAAVLVIWGAWSRSHTIVHLKSVRKERKTGYLLTENHSPASKRQTLSSSDFSVQSLSFCSTYFWMKLLYQLGDYPKMIVVHFISEMVVSWFSQVASISNHHWTFIICLLADLYCCVTLLDLHFGSLKVTVQFETEGNGQNEIVSHMDRSEVKL